MNETLTPPLPPAPSRRRAGPRLSADPERRAIQIGLLGTVAIHLLLLILAPYLMKLDPGAKLRAKPEPQPLKQEPIMEPFGSIYSLLDMKSPDIHTIPPTATVYEAIQTMSEKNIGALLVMTGETLEGARFRRA